METPGYCHDAIGSVVALTGGTKLYDSYAYDAFGNSRARTGTNPQPFQYLANAYDSTTKLYDFHARTYDSGTGRFLSEDPVAGLAPLPQTLNPYACSVNNPLRYPDPSGMLGEGLADGATAASGPGDGYYLNERADKQDIRFAGGDPNFYRYARAFLL
jgi:RHS repeat-associated protein